MLYRTKTKKFKTKSWPRDKEYGMKDFNLL